MQEQEDASCMMGLDRAFLRSDSVLLLVDVHFEEMGSEAFRQYVQ